MISGGLELFHFLSFLPKKNTEDGMGLPWWSSGYDPILPMQGAWVRSPVGELSSYMPCSVAKLKK